MVDLITYDRWIKLTTDLYASKRSEDLKAVDRALENYDKSQTDKNFWILERVFYRFMEFLGQNWKSSVRNKNKALEILLGQLSDYSSSHLDNWGWRLDRAREITSNDGLDTAFKESPFIYGTLGDGSRVAKMLKKEFKPKDRDANYFDPGTRTLAYLEQGFQMMDMYYGQKGNYIFEKRNKKVARFVHYAMGYSRPFDAEISGRDEYLAFFETAEEGWSCGSPAKLYYKDAEGRQLTATQELSRIIRWGISEYGGSIIFEGTEVYYSQVFSRTAPKIGDTDIEARDLFRYFAAGISTTPFGEGNISFYWGGKLTIPTKLHFICNWNFSPDGQYPDLQKSVKLGRGVEKNLKELPDKIFHKVGNVVLDRNGRVSFPNPGGLFDTWSNFQDVPLELANVRGKTSLELIEEVLEAYGCIPTFAQVYPTHTNVSGVNPMHGANGTGPAPKPISQKASNIPVSNRTLEDRMLGVKPNPLLPGKGR